MIHCRKTYCNLLNEMFGLLSQNIFKSNGEAKRMIQSNAVSINKEKIRDYSHFLPVKSL